MISVYYETHRYSEENKYLSKQGQTLARHPASPSIIISSSVLGGNCDNLIVFTTIYWFDNQHKEFLNILCTS